MKLQRSPIPNQHLEHLPLTLLTPWDQPFPLTGLDALTDTIIRDGVPPLHVRPLGKGETMETAWLVFGDASLRAYACLAYILDTDPQRLVRDRPTGGLLAAREAYSVVPALVYPAC